MQQNNICSLKDLLIKRSGNDFFIPNINFSAKTGKCIIEGESYLEEAFEFYDNLAEWIKEYLSINSSIEIIFKLTYFNTSSSRSIIDLFKLLKQYKEEGKAVKIDWYYENPDDGDILIEVEDFMEETNMEVNLLSLK